jgi:hypothetical protein
MHIFLKKYHENKGILRTNKVNFAQKLKCIINKGLATTMCKFIQINCVRDKITENNLKIRKIKNLQKSS